VIELEKASSGEYKTSKEYELKIINDHLGYEIDYLLRDFYLSFDTRLALGYPKFTGKEPTDNIQQNEWDINRQKAYNGSIRHFFNALMNDQLTESGFKVYAVKNDLVGLEKFGDGNTLLNDNSYLNRYISIEGTEYENIRKIVFKGLISVDYVNELNDSGNVQNSSLRMLSENDVYVYAYTNGVIVNPAALKVYGRWAEEGLYSALPFEFISNDSLHLDSNTFQSKLIKELKLFSETKPIEKIYVQTDRNDYYPGETIWMKHYVTAGPFHQLSPLSNNIYSSLINDQGNVVMTTLTLSKDGLSHSQIELPDTLPAGNYSLQAYTEMMKNYGNDFVFDKAIKINSTYQESKAEVVSNSKRIDLQFLPESGNLLEGVENIIAFRAIDVNGKPVHIKGRLLDDKTNFSIPFETTHNGVGTLSLYPDLNARYQVIVSGYDQSFKFPRVERRTAILKVDPFFSNEHIKVRVRTDLLDLNPFVINQFRGLANYSVGVDLQNGFGEILIPKASLNEGVNHLTLFSEDGMAIAQRLFFNRRDESHQINISLSASDQKIRSKQEATIEVKDIHGKPIQGHFSLSAFNINRSNVVSSHTNILAHMLLDSDLAGKIHQPAYYFESPNEEKDRELDLIMRTQGWSRFEWNELNKLTNKEDEYDYKDQLNLVGTVYREGKKKKGIEAQIHLINNFTTPPELQTTISDKNGNFILENVSILNDKEFIVQAVPANQKRALLGIDLEESHLNTLDLQSRNYWPILNNAKQLNGPAANNQKSLESTKKATFIIKDNKDYLSTITILDDVIIEADQEEVFEKKSIYGPSSKTVDIKNLIPKNQAAGLLESLKGQVPGVQIVGNEFYSMWVIVRGDTTAYYDPKEPVDLQDPNQNLFLDNVPISLGDLLRVPANIIDRLEIYTGPDAAIFGASGAYGVLMFFTRQDFSYASLSSNNISSFSRQGYSPAKTYYQPLYDNNYQDTGIPDFRISLHWEPMIQTDENGIAKVYWYNSDDAGDEIQIIVEGIGDQGGFGMGKTNYRISENKSN
jgi:hypothetical protein